ncbi:MAG TPA: DUF2283 domain-containing protein [Dehalococcoidia bacterium]
MEWRQARRAQPADALYLRLDESRIVESEEASPGAVLDFNADNQVVGVEILQLPASAPPGAGQACIRIDTRRRQRLAATRGSRPLCGSGPQP